METLNTTTDEISQVLHHFQPIPDFVTGSNPLLSKLKNGRQPKANRNSPQQASTKPKSKANKRFSSICYNKTTNTLRLVFQWDRALWFQFYVSTLPPFPVYFVDPPKNAPLYELTQPFKEQLQRLGSQLTNKKKNDNASINPTKFSLFAVISKLLQGLNNLTLPSTINAKDYETLQSKAFQKHLQQQPPVKKTVISNTKTIEPQQQQQQQRIWDLQLLLLRCAAMGRERSTFCTPIPEEFGQAYGADRAPQAIFQVSEGLQLLQQEKSSWTRPQQELMGYLWSLPLSTTASSCQIPILSDGRSTQRGSSYTIQLTLDLTLASGDPSPRFAQLAKERGTTQVYHGTKMECAWSILMCGLWSLSETKFAKHGSIFGKGVYFSTSYKVAYMFAGNTMSQATLPAKAFLPAWRHAATVRLLQLSKLKDRINIFQDYDIQCFPVFEAEIISPPSSSQSTSSETNGDKQSLSFCTRKDGNYFVVPNSRDIRVTKLHLTFELVRKEKFPWFWLAAFLVAIWAIRQASLGSGNAFHPNRF